MMLPKNPSLCFIILSFLLFSHCYEASRDALVSSPNDHTGDIKNERITAERYLLSEINSTLGDENNDEDHSEVRNDHTKEI